MGGRGSTMLCADERFPFLFYLTKVTEERLELFTIRQRSISGQPQAPKAAKFSHCPSLARLSTPAHERYPDAAAIKIHLNHLLLDLRVRQNSCSPGWRYGAELASRCLSSEVAMLNDIGSIAIRAVNRNSNSHRFSTNGSTPLALGNLWISTPTDR